MVCNLKTWPSQQLFSNHFCAYPNCLRQLTFIRLPVNIDILEAWSNLLCMTHCETFYPGKSSMYDIVCDSYLYLCTVNLYCKSPYYMLVNPMSDLQNVSLWRKANLGTFIRTRIRERDHIIPSIVKRRLVIMKPTQSSWKKIHLTYQIKYYHAPALCMTYVEIQM